MSLRNVNRALLGLLVVLILFIPGIGEQFALQVRQITRTTDVRTTEWPRWGSPFRRYAERAMPAPISKLRRITEKRDTNGDLWLGLAELEQSPSDQLKAGRRALAANPHSGAALARFATLSLAHLYYMRPEEAEYRRRRNQSALYATPQPIPRKDAEECLRILQMGAQSEPRNSFFDYAQAYIYLGFGKDDEALACLNRGDSKPIYDSHYKDAALCAARLLRMAGVPRFEATQAADSSNGMIGNWARLLAGKLQISAVSAEDQGDWSKGWRLRLPTFKMGNQMIRHGETWIDRLMGVAVQSIAVPIRRLPADVIKRIHKAPLADHDRLYEEARADAIRTYLRKHAPGKDGEWVLRQYLAGRNLSRLAKQDSSSQRGIRYYQGLFRSDYFWYWGTILLVQLLGVLLILAVLSGTRVARSAGDAVSAILGMIGVAMTSVIVLYLGRGWWAFTFRTPEAQPLAEIPAWATWAMILILPALAILGGLIALVRRRGFWRAVHSSLQWALPVIIVLYITASAITAADRASCTRQLTDSLRPGPTVIQAQMLKQAGFLAR